MPPTCFSFEVRQDDLHRHRLLDEREPEPGDGEAVLRVDHFALTANNVTYAAFGAAMGYWKFFPAVDGWGRVPVWGFADVLSSRVDGLGEGDRIYGYFPMSTHLVVQPSSVSSGSFVDAAAHRAPLPPVYNQYTRVRDRADEHAEHLQEVLRPLFTTSFLIDDWLATEQCFGARQVVIASASSKTGLALAARLAGRGGVRVVGLTSERNRAFVEGVGYFDGVAVYDGVTVLDPSVATVLVDMGGDARVLEAVHTHFGDALRHSCQVGATHWEEVRMGVTLPGPTPQLFFAPDHVVRRIGDWGPKGFDERLGAAWDSFAASTDRWMEIVVHSGRDAVGPAFEAVLDGQVPADQGYVVSYRD